VDKEDRSPISVGMVVMKVVYGMILEARELVFFLEE
jgi:hypothetical protein